MSFADPLSITISAATSSLPRVSVEGDESQYTSGDGLITVTASHDEGREQRHRRLLRIDHSKLAPDAFRPSENVKVRMSHYLIFDVPVGGYTTAEQLAVYTGFKAMYSATSDALITKLLGGES
ncbi:coat protein [ssRNA phage Gerhypos.2_35]|uniref:Coat protein n=2 Tax=Leviviricetes TaxID=2842243 RepID=A0A8S5KYQ8_9VIRU|nr:coat protein [ssRNA phage Gerhypos.2_35]QDH89298.1 MAG: hypothetical protein H2Bulk3637_000002 [Leviviridae sp.]DAD50323.1 TPA_asm: coat protein [ssRNA phage Gerhypos.2_35]